MPAWVNVPRCENTAGMPGGMTGSQKCGLSPREPLSAQVSRKTPAKGHPEVCGSEGATLRQNGSESQMEGIFLFHPQPRKPVGRGKLRQLGVCRRCPRAHTSPAAHWGHISLLSWVRPPEHNPGSAATPASTRTGTFRPIPTPPLWLLPSAGAPPVLGSSPCPHPPSPLGPGGSCSPCGCAACDQAVARSKAPSPPH